MLFTEHDKPTGKIVVKTRNSDRVLATFEAKEIHPHIRVSYVGKYAFTATDWSAAYNHCKGAVRDGVVPHELTEHDVVEIIQPHPSLASVGDTGTVVHVYDLETFEVEVTDSHQKTMVVDTFKRTQLKAITT